MRNEIAISEGLILVAVLVVLMIGTCGSLLDTGFIPENN